jgi:hypothetical protein
MLIASRPCCDIIVFIFFQSSSWIINDGYQILTLDHVMKSEFNPLGAPVSSLFLSLLMLVSSSDMLDRVNQPLLLPS